LFITPPAYRIQPRDVGEYMSAPGASELQLLERTGLQ
jgi:hypothetical protein